MQANTHVHKKQKTKPPLRASYASWDSKSADHTAEHPYPLMHNCQVLKRWLTPVPINTPKCMLASKFSRHRKYLLQSPHWHPGSPHTHPLHLRFLQPCALLVVFCLPLLVLLSLTFFSSLSVTCSTLLAVFNLLSLPALVSFRCPRLCSPLCLRKNLPSTTPWCGHIHTLYTNVYTCSRGQGRAPF